jgi:hypothetical protein
MPRILLVLFMNRMLGHEAGSVLFSDRTQMQRETANNQN